MAEEIELKLTASPAALAAVPAHPAITAAAGGRARTTHMVSTYYDTPERELAAAGVTLRLRQAGRQWLQTVKGAGGAAAGLHRRTEFEWRLAQPRVDTVKLARTPWRKLFAQHASHCKPVFATAVRRRTQPLVFADGTQATLCIDLGEIRAGRRRASLTEIELELGRGDPARLFDIATALVADLPARVTVASKAQRGYALASGATPEPRRARRVPLDAQIGTMHALAAIGGDCIAQLEVNAEVLLESNDPEFLHQIRVGWRRLRSLLRLAALVAPAEALAPLEAELDWLGTALGPARDCDVFAAETLPRIAAQFRGQPDLVRLRARVARRRRQLRGAAREALAAPRFQQLLLALGTFFVRLPGFSPAEGSAALARDWIPPLLQERHRKLRKRIRHIHRLEAAERHRARVAAKKLRYAAEFFAPLFSAKRAEEYIAALSKLQGALGRLNDLEVGARLLDESVPAAAVPDLAHARGIVRGWLAASTAPELKRLREARRGFAQCEPFWD